MEFGMSLDFREWVCLKASFPLAMWNSCHYGAYGNDPLILIHFFLEQRSHFSLCSLGHPSNSTRWTFAWQHQDEISLMNSCHFHLASSAEFSCGSDARQFVCQGRFIPTYRVLFLDIDGLVGICVKSQMEDRFRVGFGVNNLEELTARVILSNISWVLLVGTV